MSERIWYVLRKIYATCSDLSRFFYQNAPEYTREGLTKRESDISQRYKCTIGCNEIGDDLMVEA